MSEEDTLTVLLTGRKEDGFTDLIGRMIASKGLEFDLVTLKPTVSPTGELFGSTMLFKQAFLKDIVYTYAGAEELKIYEDRPKHVKAFRDYFGELNHTLLSTSFSDALRHPMPTEVIHVNEQETSMDPVAEVAEVQLMVNNHNQAILDGLAPPGSVPQKVKRSVFYTGYLISPPDIEKLKTLTRLPANCPEHEVRHLANNILITPRPAPRSIRDKVGGIGAKMRWRVTGIASFEQRVWAARVQPVESGAKIYTENNTPCVVLATRRQSKPIEASRIQNWQQVPEDQKFEFETTVGEKVLLRVEEEVRGEDSYEASFPNARNARKHAREDDFPPLGAKQANGKTALRPQQRSGNQGQGQGVWANKQQQQQGGGIGFAAQRGGGRGGRGGGQRGGFGRGRCNAQGGGRGRGRGGYRSLDDNVGQGYGSGGMQY